VKDTNVDKDKDSNLKMIQDEKAYRASCYIRYLERKFPNWSEISMFSHVIIQKYF
jgi:hypothetical protein